MQLFALLAGTLVITIQRKEVFILKKATPIFEKQLKSLMVTRNQKHIRLQHYLWLIE